MPIINLLNESAPNKSTDQNAANLINMYMVGDQDQDKYPTAAFYTPGLTLFSATGYNPIRAMFNSHEVTYVVGNNQFFSVNSSGVVTTIGTLNTSSGFAKIQGNNSQLLIIDGMNGYMYDENASTFITLGTDTYVSAVVMTAAGSGYSNTPTVNFTGGGGSGAAGTASVSNGQISGVTITNTGTGYTSAPTVSFTDPSGTGATATAYTTTSSFTNTSQDCLCQDEFGITIGNNVQTWYASNVSDLKTWPALSFASTTGNQNNLVAIASVRREIWLLGSVTTEIWYNAGNPYFTFSRRTDTYVEKGCISRDSVVQADNTLFFLGRSKEGGAEVIRMNGYTPQVISTDAINYQISTYSTISDARAFAYQQEGHTFYVLTFPTANITWVYDLTTQQWHQRQSNSGRWIPNCYTFCYNKQLVGDFNSGNIYQLDMTNYQENGSSITRTIVTHPFYNSGVQVKCSRLQIDFDQTPGNTLSNINLYVSRDGGNTFGLAKPATPVQTQDGQWRCYWTRLGQARTWVFKIQTTMNNKFITLGAWANFSIGET